MSIEWRDNTKTLSHKQIGFGDKNKITIQLSEAEYNDLKNENAIIMLNVISLESKEMWCGFEGSDERHLMMELEYDKDEIIPIRQSRCGKFVIGIDTETQPCFNMRKCKECSGKAQTR